MRKFGYIRPTKMHPEAEQRAALAHIAPEDLAVDEKPKRGEPPWYWFDKVVGFCRLGAFDEVHISHESVLGASIDDALDRLRRLTERNAVLVVASSGQRYSFHPAAASAVELAQRITAEARQAVAKKAATAWQKKAAKEREAKAAHWAETERRWYKEHETPGAVIAREQGYSRAYLGKMLGPRGSPRFGRKEPKS